MSQKVQLTLMLGPVQGFVAQSRRTRDLWSSSFLLSYLSGVAIAAAEQEGARLERPNLKSDPLYHWITSGKQGDPPQVGSIPNHAVLEVVEEAARKAASAAETAFREAWRQVCEAVRRRALPEHVIALGRGTDEIWHRQVERFWEFTWTVAPLDERDAAEILAAPLRRKQWRSKLPAGEPGDKCMIVSDLQELSGYVRAGGERVAQDRFWAAVREASGRALLRPDERLSAIGLIKRCFPTVAQEAIGGAIDSKNWPSTVNVAAFPWALRVAQRRPDLARAYADLVREVAGAGAFNTRYPVPVAAGDLRGFDRLSGVWFFVDRLKQAIDELEEALEGEQAAAIGRLSAELQKIYDEIGEAPSSFYALLLADGDRLGELLSRMSVEELSEALGRFTERIPGIVEQHGGVLVYAGGDDVLAMLPAESALRCAADLAEAYRGAQRHREGATLSAAVLFVESRTPLQSALTEVRRLLDFVAKGENGRDSLAAAVRKRGGLQAVWRTTWMRRVPGSPAPGGDAGDDAVGAVEAIEALRNRLNLDRSERISSSLLYRVRKTLGLLCDWPSWDPGEVGRVPERVDLQAFLRADVIDSVEHARDRQRERPHRSEVDMEPECGREADPEGREQAVSSSHRGAAETANGAEKDDEIDHLVKALYRVLPLCANEALETGLHQTENRDPRPRITLDGLYLAHFLASQLQKEA